jgi:putative inorganic carbon (HCO3(-)) transporter
VGFILTAVYIVVTIISPEQFGPQWANYHAVMYLAGFTFVFSLPMVRSRTNLKSSIQTFLMLGFIFAIALSKVANGWIGGAIASWQIFLPSAAVFFFTVANVTTIRRLKILTLISAASSLVVVVEALCGYYLGFHAETFVLQQSVSSPDEVYGQLARLRGAGFLSDPNDFAQILLIVLPLLFIAWQKRRKVVNSLVVLVPAALLLWAIYLTHSRGALIALAIIALMAAQKKLGTIPAAVLIAVLVIALMAVDFTGGRGISSGEGAGRLEAWANGLEMFKRAPLFGIGFGAFTDFNDLTAHNSFVLCLAELGLVGTTLWVALLVTTIINLNRIISQHQKRQVKSPSPAPIESRKEEFTLLDSVPNLAESPAAAQVATALASEAGKEIRRENQPVIPIHWLLAMRLALVGFIATCWFLSRSYSTPMYLVLGLATAAIAIQQPVAQPSYRSRWLFFTIATEAVALICVYGMAHLRS